MEDKFKLALFTCLVKIENQIKFTNIAEEMVQNLHK